MEFRKLIGFGKSSLVVSLPKAWLSQNNLTKGDLVYLTPDKDEMVVSAKERRHSSEPKKISIDAENKSLRRIEGEIVSAYLDSNDLWEIRGSMVSTDGHAIKAVLQDLSGMEILEHDSSHILARDLLDMSDLSIESVLRRIDLIIRSMLDDCLAPIHEDFHEGISDRDRDVNRLCLLVKRIVRISLDQPSIAKRLGKSNLSLLKDWEMASSLESVGDEVKRLSRYCRGLDHKDKFSSQVGDGISSLRQKYLDVMRSYHTNAPDLARTVEEDHKSFLDGLDSITPATSSKESHRLSHHLKGLSAKIKDLARVVVL